LDNSQLVTSHHPESTHPINSQQPTANSQQPTAKQLTLPSELNHVNSAEESSNRDDDDTHTHTTSGSLRVITITQSLQSTSDVYAILFLGNDYKSKFKDSETIQVHPS
jgi:hypothetical protein